MKGIDGAKKVALCATMTATLEISKLALSALANVETVSLLTAVYAYVFGPISLLAVLAFVLLEIAVWGAQIWVVYYIIHFCTIALIFYFYGKFKVKNLLIFVITIVVLTAMFGILSSFFDVAIGGFNNFLKRFSIYYVRGVWFYVVHIVSNAVIFSLAFKPLSNLMEKLKIKFFSNENNL